MASVTPSDLGHEEYGDIRRKLDSRRAVAWALGIHPETLGKRERGELPISVEAGLALRFLWADGLPEAVRARLSDDLLLPEPSRWAKPGELREAFAILGWNVTEGARQILGPGPGPRSLMSRYLTGDRACPEKVARHVKRRLGLAHADAWPVRAAREWVAPSMGGLDG
jgi:hypothetical protein